jgi:hypothetical protein
MGLRANEGKTKYMEVTRPTGQKVFQVLNHEFECVKEFKYLGSEVTNSRLLKSTIG